MSENEQQEQASGPQLSIEKIYVKDISFEMPAGPEVFTENWQPEVNMDLNTQARLITDNIYDVELTITVTAKNSDKTAFLVEVKQCGIFNISGVENDTLNGLLGAYCPNVLFPYSREAISDLVAKGGFPQLLLAPVNFDALYAQQKQAAEGESIN